MKRNVAVLSGVVASTALFGFLVYAVLLMAQVSEPAATTVQGLTLRRLWATTTALVALVGVVTGGLALVRRGSLFRTAASHRGAIVALTAGFIAVVNGILNLAMANGGPGSGNGVVGAAAAVVLGVVALALSGLALTRLRRAA